MRWEIGVLALFMLIVSSGFVLGLDDSGTLTVSVNVLRTDFIGVEIPSFIDFGDIEAGEKSTTFDLYINNTGNVDITVTPELVNNSEEIFSYLFFQRVQADDLARIGNWSVDISAPSEGNDVRSDRNYVTLDLTEFTGEISEDMLNHQADVIFWALPQ